MSYEVILSKEAEENREAAYQYYRSGVGAEFVLQKAAYKAVAPEVYAKSGYRKQEDIT